MNKIKILWVDDEIDLLKPHILFSEKKNYEVTTCNNGQDAIDLFEENNFDIVFLDENMPGLSGLETLSEIKEKEKNWGYYLSLLYPSDTLCSSYPAVSGRKNLIFKLH